MGQDTSPASITSIPLRVSCLVRLHSSCCIGCLRRANARGGTMLRSIGIAALSIGLFASTALAEYASQPKALTPEETAFCEALGEGAAMFAGHRLIGNTL